MEEKRKDIWMRGRSTANDNYDVRWWDKAGVCQASWFLRWDINRDYLKY